MEVTHLETKQNHTITKEDWEVLGREGLQDRYKVVSDTDFSPPELELPTKDDKKKDGPKAAQA